MNNQLKLATLAAALAVFSTGCATYTGQTTDPNDPNRTQRGALIGAAIGAAAGLLSGDDAVERRQRALVGAGVGALAGGSIGAYQDRQEAELRREAAGTGIAVTRDGDVIKLNLPDGVTFDFAKYDLKPQFYPALNNIAGTLQDVRILAAELKTTKAQADALLASLNAAVDENRPGLRQSVADIESSIGAIAQRIDAITHHLESSSRNFDEFSREIRRSPNRLLFTAPQDEVEE